MILTGPEIARAVAEGSIRIDDFDPARIEPNSYGFRLAPQLLVYERETLDSHEAPASRRLTMDDDGTLLEPGRFYLGSTMEAMGSPSYAATLYACRSVSTLGVWIQFSAPLGHSGAVFPWTLEITVANPVRLYPGMRIGKLAFWAMQGEPRLYDGKYTGSTEAVGSRLSDDFAGALAPVGG
ncbi:deoxycytidine triphosphate deaminase [Streptomyces sp. NBC_01136]|uniref:dCTP deaminase n=1 Tax=unclassified Streptomyces TaxID=2593676 RepID=UPI0032437DF2|nr:deoxycytidine triphosphate deaminase [Streptomyces sp. NBC_01136]